MGNSKFRLSIPNAWFYKLKDMGMRGKIHNSNTYSIRKKQTKTSPSSAAPPSPNPKHHHHYPRKSYYFTRDVIPTCDQTFHTNSPLSTKSPHTHSPDPPPRKSSKQRVALSRRTTATTSSRSSPKMVTTTSSVSAGCSCRASLWTNSDSPPLDCSASPSDTSSQELFCSHSFPPEFRSDRILATTNDVHVINVDNKLVQNTNRLENPNMFDEMSDLHLPPIITKPPSKFSKNGLEKEEDIKKKKDAVINNPTTKNIRRRRISAKNEETEDAAAAAANGSFSEKQSITSSTTIKEQSKNNTTNSVKRNNHINSVTSPGGIRLRVNSPRIVSRRKSIGSSSNYSSSSLSRSNNNRGGGGGRRSLSDSLAIVKSSFDPQKDFRESMVEMIMENNIKGSKELEDLLACYLSLNADEYHELIIMVFKQLWFDLTHITRPNNN